MDNSNLITTIKSDLLPHQLEFIENEGPRPYLYGDHCSGKTYALCTKALLAAIRNPHQCGVVITHDHRQLKDIAMREMVSKLKRHDINYILYISSWRITLPIWGSTILFRSGGDTRRLYGPRLAWVAIDNIDRWHDNALRDLYAMLGIRMLPENQIFATIDMMS